MWLSRPPASTISRSRAERSHFSEIARPVPATVALIGCPDATASRTPSKRGPAPCSIAER